VPKCGPGKFLKYPLLNREIQPAKNSYRSLASPAVVLYRPQVPWFFAMWAIKVTFALFLGVTGIIGCATNERLYHPTASSTAQLPSPKPAPDTVSDSPTAAAAPQAVAPAMSEQPVPTQQDPTEQSRDLKPAIPLDRTEEKTASAENREKPTPTKKPAPATPPPQPGRAFQADNRLLELLEKDLDKAVEQGTQQRRLQFSKEVIDNPKVRHFINYYSNTGKNRFRELLARSGKYMPMIAKVLTQEGLPEELGYLALLESEFVVNTISRNGAVGLWQFIATTGRRYGLRIDEWVDERRDPVKSTRAAAAYLKDLHNYFGRWYLATAAYNAGPGTIEKALQQSGAKDFWSIKAKAQMSEETRNFVPKFVAIALIAMDPKKYGFNDIRYELSLDYEEIELKAPTTLAALAEMVESNVTAIRGLNPALLHPSTPPGEVSFRVNLPVGKAAVFLAKASEKILEKETERTRLVTHEVKQGETLFSIARHYGLEVRALMEFNSLTTPRLRIGQKLLIFLQSFRRTFR
jgi:membrane-bound lytic murein transglycosylase D